MATVPQLAALDLGVPAAVAEHIRTLVAAFAELPAHQRLATSCYAVVVVAVTSEIAVRWARERRPAPVGHALAAAVMGAGALVVGLAYTAVFHLLWTEIGRWAPAGLSSLWASHPLLAFALAFVAWDASGFAYHLIGHRTRLGWAAHRPHHTGTEYDLSLALRLSWLPVHGLLHHPLLALLGWSFPTIVACAAVSNLLQALQHTAAPVRFPRWVSATVMTPEHHRHHHATGAGVVNLGPVLTCWDRLAGTYRAGPVPSGTTYGLATGAVRNPVRAELDGWLALLGTGRAASDAARATAGAPAVASTT